MRAVLTFALLPISFFFLSNVHPSLGAEPTSATGVEVFSQQIGPVLAKACLDCHGPDVQESGLRLDTSEAMLSGGDRGPAVIAGEPEQSPLYLALLPHYDDLQMPPDAEPLTDGFIQSVAQWIQAGAVWPEDVESLSQLRAAFSIRDRQYWAFQPIADPKIPRPTGPPGWCQSDIDRFTAKRMTEEGLQPLPEADRTTLIRRLYFDLLGIPPTPAEVEQFINDQDPAGYVHLVDRLLKRPEYGERSARRWLDLVRYAESDGFKADVYRPYAWRYRDYVIQAFNEDRPYDRFISEQLAGDELYPDNQEARIATGYLRLWPLEDNQKDVQRQWNLILQDVTEITGEAFLGLGLRCARCHDHKFDPILQKDYYRMQAFFAAMLPRDDLLVVERGPTEGLTQWEDTTRDIRHAMKMMESRHVASRSKTIAAYPPYLQEMYRKPVEQRDPYDRQLAYLARPQIEKKSAEEIEFKGELKERWERLNRKLADFGKLKPQRVGKVMSVTDVGRDAPAVRIGNREDGQVVQPGYLSILDPSDASIEPPEEVVSTGRRTQLARWMTDPANPLFRRVIVNRLWQQHFGRGIVATANDFGRQGTPPTHPQLLNWLASRLLEDDWSLKSMHRRIVLSATYRQRRLTHQDTPDVAISQRLFHGRLPTRLDAEQIRDAMLAVSGEMEYRGGGPGVDGKQPVRSIYVKNIRNKPDVWLSTFDGPDMFNSCSRRFVTTTPLQSLMTLNSQWALSRATSLAERVCGLTPAPEERVKLVYELVLGRDPSIDEQQLANQFLQDHEQQEGTSRRERLTDLCHTLLCSNEFIYVD